MSPRQLNDAIGWDAGDTRGPLRRFGDAVVALAEDIGFIVAILRRPGRQRLLIVADAVFIKERLIHQILVNQHPGDTGDQRGVRAGANGDPLIFATGGGIGVARIDNDHPHVGALAGLFQIPGNAAAAHAGFRRVVAEHHHQLAVFNI